MHHAYIHTFYIATLIHVHSTVSMFNLQALTPIGAMFGGLVAWPISDRLGCKVALMLSGVPALVGWLMIALAFLVSSHVHAVYGILLAGRTLTGFSIG